MSTMTVVNKINKKVSELTTDDIANYCQEAGITISSLCLKLNDLLNATRDIKDRDGDIIDTVADNNVQLKALTVALELLKLVNGKTVVGTAVVQHQMASGDIDRLEGIAKELKGLEGRLVEDKIQQGVVIDL